MQDAVILSDLHLGSAVCQSTALVEFLDSVLSGELAAERLILNGDVFDTYDFRRMTPEHWQILDMLRMAGRVMDVIWVSGNHDGPPRQATRLLGVPVVAEYEFASGASHVLILHGDRFDGFIAKYPLLTDVADWFYRTLQRVDPSHTLARFAKHRSKTFLRCTGKLATAAIEYAEERDCDVVCCGHTHFAVACEDGPVRYYNSGCWTEKPCHYLTVNAGRVALHEFRPDEPVRVTSAEPVTAAP